MQDFNKLKMDLLAFGTNILTVRLEKLKARKFVLFPWVRTLLLIRKVKKLSQICC